ncbi:MAG: AzlD domain-containing protein [Proteobacteria bacterium]|nr:AzlD domain-containing protein [Pseudomonadota bacterium]MDA1059908.1 AzlD domain-containing protein [Pseudomonadota bacterium]
MDQTGILLTAAGMGAVALAIRASPLLLLGGRKLPRPIEEALHFLPAAALAAITVQLLVVRDGALQVSIDDVTWWALLPSVAVAILTRSTFLTVAVGMAIVAGSRLIAG